MPEKSLETRARAAKKKGTPVMLKDTDVGRAGGRSSHAVKKSRGIAADGPRALKAGFEDRSVSTRRSPGQGKASRGKSLPLPEGGSSSSRRKTLPTVAAAAYRKDGSPKRPSSEAAQRRKSASARGTDLQGRKKAPGQMGVKRKGGPRKSLRLHGG
jgi:hypothetical protein